jgi:predicted lipoprotein with Yx(FWY)xxD motif
VARLALLLVLLAGAACGGQASAAQETCTAASQATCQPRLTFGGGPLLRQTRSRYGRLLVTDQGYPVYRFTADGPDLSRCSGPCSDRWPPLIVPPGTPLGSPDLSTFARPDGRRQLAYRGIPLYVYSSDEQDLAYGEDVYDAGGWWYVVTADDSRPDDPAPSVAP